MIQWNDRKSHEINEKYIPSLQHLCRELNSLFDETQLEIKRIETECDQI